MSGKGEESAVLPEPEKEDDYYYYPVAVDVAAAAADESKEVIKRVNSSIIAESYPGLLLL